MYIQKRTTYGYSCTCLAWRYQKRPRSQKTCKHLRQLYDWDPEVLPPTTAPFHSMLLLALFVPSKVSDWSHLWAQEKLDGYRVRYQNGQLWTRSGQLLTPPTSWWQKEQPQAHITEPLDGELWAGRGQLARVASAYQGTGTWTGLQIVWFDVDLPLPYSKRYQWLKTYHLRVPQNYILKGEESAKRLLQKWTDDGAEGMVVRDTQAIYKPGRRQGAWKWKGHLKGQGTIVQKRPQSVQVQETQSPKSLFWIKVTDDFNINDRVSFTYQGRTTHEKPRFASKLILKSGF